MFTQNELGLRQSMWLELLKDYDMSIPYHPCKVKIIIDALNRLSMDSTAMLRKKRESKRNMCIEARW